MKQLRLLIIILFSACTTVSYANNTNVEELNTSTSKNISQAQQTSTMDLVMVNSYLSQQLKFNGLSTSKNFNVRAKSQNHYQTQLLSLKIGIVQSYNELPLNKYVLHSSVIIHKRNDFSLVALVNIEQLDFAHFYYLSNQEINNSMEVNEVMLNYTYGIMSSYSMSEAWHFSGGIIHSTTTHSGKRQHGSTAIIEPDDNMALIGTTYSF